jgi:hypothetical protein
MAFCSASSLLASPRTISTKGIWATGLKKWMPTSLPGSGRLSSSCSSMIEGRIRGEDGLRAHARLETREQLVLGGDIFEDRLDDYIGTGDAITGHIRGNTRHELGCLAGILEALFESFARALAAKAR